MLVPLYDAERQPYKGLFSSPSPVALGMGMFSAAQNVREDGNALSCRNGVTALLSAGPSVTNGVFVGGAIETWGSNLLALAGIYDPAVSKVRIYYNLYSGSWLGWGESTASSGKWGDTRMTMPTDGPLQFVRLSNLDGSDKFVVQSGIASEKPRIIMEDGSPTAIIASVVDPVLSATAEPAIAGMKKVFTVSTGTWTHSVTAGGNTWTTTTAGTTPDQYINLASGAGVGITSGKASQSILAAGLDLTDCRQACFIWACALDDQIWQKVKVELVIGATPTYLTILDPDNNILEAVTTERVFASGSESFYMTAIPIPPGTTVTDVRGFRITAQQDLISDIVLKIAMFAGGGRVPGGAEYALAFENSFTDIESPGIVLVSGGLVDGGNQDLLNRAIRGVTQSNAASVGEYKITGVLTMFGGSPVTVQLPVDSRIYYEYQVPVFSPSQTQGELGVNFCNIYRRDPGEEAFTYVYAQQAGAYVASAWTYYTPFTAWSQRSYYADNTSPSSRDANRVLPDEFCEPPPAGYPMVASNNRLYVGATEGTGSGQRAGAVWVSEEGRPLRFRAISRWESGQIAQEAGFVVSVGTSRPQALVAASGQFLGVSSIYCATQDDLWVLDSQRASRVSSVGSLSSLSFAERDGALFYLSDEQQAVQFGGGASNLSRNSVDDFLTGIAASRLGWVASIAYKDRWLMAFTASGGSQNTRVLVYNRVTGHWESCDSLPTTEAVAQFSGWLYGGAKKTVYWTPTGAIMQWDSGSTDNSTAITMTLTTKEFLPLPRTSIKAYRMSVEGTTGSATLTCRRTFGSTNVDGTITQEATGMTRKIDASSGAPVGGRGDSVKLTLTGTPGAGWKLHRWECDLKNCLGDGASAG